MFTLRPPLATFLLCLVCFVWGAEFVLVDMAITELPTNTFTAFRFGIAAIAIWPFIFFNKNRATDTNLLKLYAMGFLLGFILFLAFYAQTEALRFTSVSNTGFINGLIVPLVPILSFVILRKRTAIHTWLGVSAATVGLILLTSKDTQVFNLGDLLALLGAVAFAAHIVLTGHFVSKNNATLLSLIQLIAVTVYSTSVILLSPAPAFYYPDMPAIGWFEQLFSPTMVLALLVTGLAGTAFAYWVQSAGQAIVAPHKVALIFALEPVWAHVTAWFFLDEHLDLKGWIGAALIIAAMLISELWDHKTKAKLASLDHSSAPYDDDEGEETIKP